MDSLKAFSVDFHTTVAASLLRKALEAPEGNLFISGQQLTHYTEETFPIMVSVKGSLIQPVICTIREPFDEFLADLRRIMKMAAKPEAFLVAWESGNSFYYGSVTPENLHVILRTMRMRPGKDKFELVRRV